MESEVMEGKAATGPEAGETAPAPVYKKVAIVGCSDSKNLAPYDDKTWDVWAMNNAFSHVVRRTAWFEIHPVMQLPNGQFQRRKLIRPGVFEWSDEFRGMPMKEYIESLAHLGCPVYMQQHWDAIPQSIPYPLEEITRKFGRYFTNSVSFMIALAIAQGYREIGCYGVDMSAACTAPDVKVLRSDLKWVRADSLNVGDEVIGFDETPDEAKFRRWRTATVTSCNRFTKPCYRMKLEDGTEMIVSARHGWLTNAEHNYRWRAQENMITPHHRTDRPSRISRVLDTWDHDDSWEAGYLAAAFDGEGHISQAPRNPEKYKSYTHGLVTGYAQKPNELSETVDRILQKRGFSCRMNVEEDSGTRKYRINGGKSEILRFLGSIRPPRLLGKLNTDILGQFISKENVAIIESEFIGNHEVIGLETSTKTFIAEGLASHNSEYGPQRPSCEYFLGVAVGLGIKVHIPPQADLLKTRFLYGFEERLQVAWESKMQQMLDSMEQRKAKALAQAQHAQKQIDQYVGAQEAIRETQRVWSNLNDAKIWVDPC